MFNKIKSMFSKEKKVEQQEVTEVISGGETFEKIKSILVKHLKLDESTITESTNIFEDLGADSLDLVEIAMEMENEFGISIPDEDIGKIKTIKEAIAYINSNK